jgi:hypothetical protein
VFIGGAFLFARPKGARQMAVPQQVQAAADRAEEMLKKHQGGESGEEGKNPDEDQPENDEIAKPKTEPEDEEGETETPKEPSDDSGEIERLTRENQTLTSLNKSLDNENRHLKIKCEGYVRQIKELQDDVEAAKRTKQQSVVELTDEERAALEEEGISERIIKLITSKIKPPEKNDEGFKRLEQETQTIKMDTADLKKERFLFQLERAVPDWQAVNSDPSFLRRLSENVPYQQYTYQDLLNNAANNYDSATVSKIFADLRPKAQKEIQPKKTLADIAEPKANLGSVPIDKNKDKWDSKKISNFYREVKNNPRKYTPEQIQEIERKHNFQA